jgi:hypothetical protein
MDSAIVGMGRLSPLLQRTYPDCDEPFKLIQEQ